MLVPAGRYGRRIDFPLRPDYITIHSTQNRGTTALQHAIGMQRGAFRGRSRWNRTGYLTWHFTVDDREVVQSLPLSIQGEHADHDGPGNRTSIAIEICEFRAHPRRQAAAVARAAELTAWLRRPLPYSPRSRGAALSLAATSFWKQPEKLPDHFARSRPAGPEMAGLPSAGRPFLN